MTLVGAAAPVKLDSATEAKRIQKRRQAWQTDAWDYFDALGEVKYGATFLGNSLSKLRLFVGVRPEPNDDPVPIAELDERETPPNAAEAEDALNRLKSPVSGHSEILRLGGINLTIPGEGYLVGINGRSGSDDDEEWGIHSIDEVEPKGDKFVLKEAEPRSGQTASGGRELAPAADMVVRIWLPHPRFTQKADSPLHGVLDICEELLLLERAVRSQAKSRIPAGVLLWPEELSRTPVQPVGGGSEEGPPPDKVLSDLATALVTPIQDEQDASAVVPFVVKGKSEILKEVRHISFERSTDANLETRTERALRRLAQGLNVPVEVILGLADVNHWTAWQITDDTFKSHVEPLALILVESLTVGYLHAMLKAAGVPAEIAEKFVIWYDPAKLVIRPNRAQDAKDAHNAIVISDATYRKDLGYDDNDAPDDAERARREARARPTGRPGDPPADEQGPPPDEEPDDDDEEDADASTTPDVLVAAAGSVEEIGERLFALDRALKARLEVAFDAVLRRAIDRAGSKLWNRAKGKGAQIKEAIQGVARIEIASTLGPTLVASLGFTEEELLEGAVDGLAEQFDSWVRSTQRAALRVVPGLSADERATIEPVQDRDRAEAWNWTRETLLTAARDLLYDPSPDPPAEGEFDPSVVVPYRIVREAVARAGGAAGEDAPLAAAAGSLFTSITADPIRAAMGVAQGWLMQRVLGEHDVELDEYEWAYGEFLRARPFEPHEELDGARFTNFDDVVLTNPEAWPPFAFYMPGDHDGCRCDFKLVTKQAERVEAA